MLATGYRSRVARTYMRQFCHPIATIFLFRALLQLVFSNRVPCVKTCYGGEVAVCGPTAQCAIFFLTFTGSTFQKGLIRLRRYGCPCCCFHFGCINHEKKNVFLGSEVLLFAHIQHASHNALEYRYYTGGKSTSCVLGFI